MSIFSSVLAAIFILFTIAPDSWAQNQSDNGIPEKKKFNSDSGINSWNLNFGLGVEQFRDPYVDQAAIRGPDKIVVLQRTFKTLPSAWLTATWNVWGAKQESNKRPTDVRDTKFGFFAGVKLLDSNSSTFSAFSLGPQVSFELATQVISVGVGWVTHKTRKLASGIEAGKSLPAQYDDIEYEEGTENSYTLMMSINLSK